MKVIFYTATCYMDISAEIINVLKHFVQLHVIIEITQKSKNQNIIDVDELPDNEVFVSPEKLLSTTNYNRLQPYLQGTASTNFLVYNNDSFFSSIKKTKAIYTYINKIKPDILHIEALLIRSFCLLPSFHKFKKVVLSIHDPIAHFGEKDMRLLSILKSFILNHNRLKGIFFYSNFAKKQFETYGKHVDTPKWILKMNPYSYFKNLENLTETLSQDHILFFGRISPYKGIEVLLNSIAEVFSKFPKQQLIIAGESVKNYDFPTEILKKFPNNITIINRYLPNEELVRLIKGAKFIVCPYIEATQSGVLMTSFALNRPVIASNVGAFTEYIEEGKNGYLISAENPEILTNKINYLLENDHYLDLTKVENFDISDNKWEVLNKDLLKEAYTS